MLPNMDVTGLTTSGEKFGRRKNSLRFLIS